MMLSRSAEDLFWLGRYVERAENTARVLDAAHRMTLMPGSAGSEALQWRPALQIGPDPAAFDETYGDSSSKNVITYMVLDRDNASSVWSCLKAARENARAERATMTTEMWESLNQTWLEIQGLDYAMLERWGLRKFFDWVKERCQLFRGVALGTLLQDEVFQFLRLGTYIERADNTARILDVKYHVLLPSAESVGGVVDYYQWGALLRSVGAFSAYRRVYRDSITPARVAELLIFNPDLPRSLHAGYIHIVETLERLAGARRLECRRLSGEIHASLRFGLVDEVIEAGLHEFLEAFILRNNRLGSQIQRDFMMSEVVVVD